MKFASFLVNDTATWGAVVDGDIYDLGPTGIKIAADLRAAIGNGLLPEAARCYTDAPPHPESGVTLLPVVPNPGKILCIGVNYRSHQQETGKTEQTAPTVFTRFADTQIGHLRDAQMPKSTEKFDYEGELAVIIGQDAFHVSEGDAYSVIAGYAPYNDFTARDWQRNSSQWIPGKNFPGTGGFGPYLVEARDIPDITALVLETRVNGDIRQKASVADLYFSIPQLIAYVTAFTPLHAGDVLVTGTPGGVGVFMDPPGLLSVGDVVEVEITDLGVLRNTVGLGD